MSAYRVEPEAAYVELPEQKRPSFLGYALGYAFLVYMLGFPAVVLLSALSPSVAAVARAMDMGAFCFAMMKIGALVGVPLGILICWVKLNKAKSKYALDCANGAAAATAREANAILETCDRELSNLPNWLREAETWVKQATYEYSERALAPFWEAVERAAERLALCSASADRLKAKSERYNSLLLKKRHNFPLNPIRGPVPDPGAILVAFRGIVRKGQTDPQFAMIWELRATRKAIIAGFSSLGEAVNNVSFSLSAAFADLGASVSKETSLLGAEQREGNKLLRQQDRKLDAIQRRLQG
jgi:hypothetical protein